MILRFVFLLLFTLALSRQVYAEECKILWWNLFLEPATVRFEKLSDRSAVLTLMKTSAGKQIEFDLSRTVFSTDNGNELDVLFGSRTLVFEGIANHLTLTLQSKTRTWLIDFQNSQRLTGKDGQVYHYETNTSGYLICERLRPWY